MAKDILELQAGALLGIANQDMERVRGMVGGLMRRLHDAMKAKEAQKEALAMFCESHGRRIALGNYAQETLYSAGELRAMDILMFNKMI